MTKDELFLELYTDSNIEPFLTEEEIEACCVDAARETGWVFPVSGDFKEYWIKQRAERNCFAKLWMGSARKFKVEQLNLNQRFDHYGKILEKMDAAFQKAMEENPAMFSTAAPHEAFGSVAGPGFVYDITGKDVTRFFN